jgi:hypothetical protein
MCFPIIELHGANCSAEDKAGTGRHVAALAGNFSSIRMLAWAPTDGCLIAVPQPPAPICMQGYLASKRRCWLGRLSENSPCLFLHS